MAGRSHSETTDISSHRWQLRDCCDLELMRATYRNHEYPRHFHETYVIQVVEEGLNEFNCGGRIYRAEAGDILFIHPGEVHTGRSCGEKPLTYRAVYPTPEFMTAAGKLLGASACSAPRFVHHVVQDRELSETIQRLHRTAEYEPSHSGWRHEWSNVLARLLDRYGTFDGTRFLGATGCDAVEQARLFMEQNLHRRITLAEIAKAVNRSPFHFLRVFDRRMGMPPHQYLLNIRLLAGREMLRCGLSIAETALKAGFADQSHFTRSLRRVFGATPGSMRG